ncbi:TIGR04219 family outer membrane beta-barrel protein [Sulfurimonas sp.]|uniref:TIGR04219 family outer membrane beta-barrel protein n=1 Tax=Sulfurimonas sp. TaxID=2022749 RepID=UPI0025CCD0E8|nr:TIGR04219 family outer membrane beta-barrel protein [Sulfurimonas sp.]
MKKILSIMACGAILASSASADFTRVEAGAGAWMQSSKGTASYTDAGANGSYISNEKDSTQPYVWMLIKHPIPILPNLRLEYTSVKDDGAATGKFKDFNIGVATTTLSYDIKQYDIIPYYNILDNTAWITLDLGVDIKILDASYRAAPSGAFTGYSDSAMLAVPLLYARARVQIPSTNIGIESDIKYLTTGNSTVYDFRAKVDYTLDFVPVVQPAVEIGYRTQKIDIDESGVDVKANVEFSGFYAGMMVRF